MVEVKRKDKEHVGSLLRRFSERVKKSGVLNDAREAQFFKRAPSRRQRRETALMKEKLRGEKEMARKIGKEV